MQKEEEEEDKFRSRRRRRLCGRSRKTWECWRWENGEVWHGGALCLRPKPVDGCKKKKIRQDAFVIMRYVRKVRSKERKTASLDRLCGWCNTAVMWPNVLLQLKINESKFCFVFFVCLYWRYVNKQTLDQYVKNYSKEIVDYRCSLLRRSTCCNCTRFRGEARWHRAVTVYILHKTFYSKRFFF